MFPKWNSGSLMYRLFFLPLFVIVLVWSAIVRADDADNRFNTAKTAFDLRQYDQARAGFDGFLQNYASHVRATEAMFYLAESLFFLEQYALAEQYYGRVASVGLENPFARVALFRLGDVPYVQGNYDLAKTRLVDFINKLPHDPNLQFVLYYLGDIAMRANSAISAEEAEFYFNQSVTLYPQGEKFLESQIGLAWAKNQLGHVSEANAIFQQLLNSTNPAIVEPATYQWGVAQYERGEYQNAVNTLTDFQRRWPKSVYLADSQRVLARCKGGLNDFEGAFQTISQILQPTVDDDLLKVRCLYRLKRASEAMSVLTNVEHRAGAAYRDEIALLQSVFYYDQQKWGEAIAKLESFLQPYYSSGRITFGYFTSQAPAGTEKLPDDTVLKACALLALNYAKNGNKDKADATLAEMQGRASLIGGNELYTIVTETQKHLADIDASNNNGNNRPNRPTPPGGQWTPDRNGGRWNANNGRPSHNSRGNDLEQFQYALRQFERKNWQAVVSQLDSLLDTTYSRNTKQASINYDVANDADTMNAVTFAKACSMLILAKGELGEFDQANALLSAFENKISRTDLDQTALLADTRSELFAMAGNNGRTNSDQWQPDKPGKSGSLLTESEQRAVMRECNTLYKNRRYDQADTKLRDLIAKNPSEDIHAEALLLRSKTVHELGREREAILLLETICDEFAMTTPYSDALWFLGTYYESGGDLETAVKYFEPLAKNFPNYKNIDAVLYYLGAYDLEYGTRRMANAYFMRIYRNYQHGKFWSHAAWMLAYDAYKKRDYTAAETYTQKILQHPPDRVILDRVLYLKGELALRSEDFETAFIAFRDIGTLCPDSPLRDTADKSMQIAAEKTLTR